MDRKVFRKLSQNTYGPLAKEKEVKKIEAILINHSDFAKDFYSETDQQQLVIDLISEWSEDFKKENFKEKSYFQIKIDYGFRDNRYTGYCRITIRYNT